MDEQVKRPWPWLGKAVDQVTDEQIAAYLRSCHKDYPVGASKDELLAALSQAGWEVPGLDCCR